MRLQVYKPNLQGFLKLRRDFIIMTSNIMESHYDLDAYHNILNNSIEYFKNCIKETFAKELVTNTFPKSLVDCDNYVEHNKHYTNILCNYLMKYYKIHFPFR